MNGYWTKAVAAVREQIAPEVFNLWIKPLRPGQSLADGRLEILSKNDFAAEYVRNHYGTLLESVISVELGTHQPLLFRADPDAKPFSPTPPPKAEPEIVAPPSLGQANLMDRYTFDTFVVGSCNQFAHAASERVAEGSPLVYNPLYIYGGVGLGKTHLLHAIGIKTIRDRPICKVLYISSEKFMTLFIDSTRQGRVNDFKERFRSVDVLLVDDIQFFTGKKRTQEEFFHTFNALYGENKQIVLTSDTIPAEMDTLEERLRSRFAQGLVVDLQLPDLETRVAILKKKAALENIDLQDDVAFLLADAIRSNVRELEGALVRVFAMASLTKVPVTASLVKESLRSILRSPQQRQVTADEIQRTVAAYFKVPALELRSNKRAREFSHPRQVAMYLCKKLTNSSYPDIGSQFGGRDHTTVLYAVGQIEKKQLGDQILCKDLDSLTEMLSN